MAIEVKRKAGESNESLLRRFSDRIKRSRVLILAKKRRFKEQPKSKGRVRQDAKVRAYNRAKREYMIKVGKLPEVSDTRQPFRR